MTIPSVVSADRVTVDIKRSRLWLKRVEQCIYTSLMVSNGPPDLHVVMFVAICRFFELLSPAVETVSQGADKACLLTFYTLMRALAPSEDHK